MNLLFEWFKLVGCSKLDPGDGAFKHLSAYWEWRWLVDPFIAELQIAGRHLFGPRVDAVPLLYEFLLASAEFAASGQFKMEVGEEHRLYGEPEGGQITLKLTYEIGRRHDVDMQRSLSPSNVSLFLCLIAADLARSIEKLGLDLEDLFNNYPLESYHRNRW